MTTATPTLPGLAPAAPPPPAPPVKDRPLNGAEYQQLFALVKDRGGNLKRAQELLGVRYLTELPVSRLESAAATLSSADLRMPEDLPLSENPTDEEVDAAAELAVAEAEGTADHDPTMLAPAADVLAAGWTSDGHYVERGAAVCGEVAVTTVPLAEKSPHECCENCWAIVDERKADAKAPPASAPVTIPAGTTIHLGGKLEQKTNPPSLDTNLQDLFSDANARWQEFDVDTVGEALELKRSSPGRWAALLNEMVPGDADRLSAIVHEHLMRIAMRIAKSANDAVTAPAEMPKPKKPKGGKKAEKPKKADPRPAILLCPKCGALNAVPAAAYTNTVSIGCQRCRTRSAPSDYMALDLRNAAQGSVCLNCKRPSGLPAEVEGVLPRLVCLCGCVVRDRWGPSGPDVPAGMHGAAARDARVAAAMPRDHVRPPAEVMIASLIGDEAAIPFHKANLRRAGDMAGLTPEQLDYWKSWVGGDSWDRLLEAVNRAAVAARSSGAPGSDPFPAAFRRAVEAAEKLPPDWPEDIDALDALYAQEVARLERSAERAEEQAAECRSKARVLRWKGIRGWLAEQPGLPAGTIPEKLARDLGLGGVQEGSD